MMSRRPNEAKGRFARKSGFRGQNRPARGQTAQFVDQRISLLDLLDMRAAVNPFQRLCCINLVEHNL